MSSKVTIVDYGVGNLLSVARAIKAAGGETRLAQNMAEIVSADRLVLPGVGAFGHCSSILRSRHLVEPIRAFAATGKPFLGICVGMQLMLDESTEFGLHPGLGLIPGRVDRLPDLGIDGTAYKIPFVGWNRLLRPVDGDGWEGSILEGLKEENARAYFTHSYVASPRNPAHTLAQSDYSGRRMTCAVRHENLSGCQFHPEKSGPVGLSILANFLAL